jgi:hypothetical protein
MTRFIIVQIKALAGYGLKGQITMKGGNGRVCFLNRIFKVAKAVIHCHTHTHTHSNVSLLILFSDFLAGLGACGSAHVWPQRSQWFQGNIRTMECAELCRYTHACMHICIHTYVRTYIRIQAAVRLNQLTGLSYFQCINMQKLHDKPTTFSSICFFSACCSTLLTMRRLDPEQ